MVTQQTVYQITAQDGTAVGWISAKATANKTLDEIEKSTKTTADRINAAWQTIKGGILVELGRQAALSLKDAQVEAQKLAATLNFSSNGRAGEELDYLRNITRQLGVDFGTASTAYAKFAAAAKGTGLSTDTIRATFEGISKASSQLGLSADETQGALLALSQMISKGSVQAEELRGQLGERLPGAFNLAAKAMGVTTAELGKMLEAGQVTANDFLPKFAAELNKTYSATDNLVAGINRLNSAWEDWKRTFSEGGGGGMDWLTRGINESAAAMRNLGSEAGIVRRILVAIGGFEFGALGGGKFDTTAVREKLQAQFADAQDNVRKMQALKEKQGGYLNPFEAQTLGDYERQLKSARRALDDLAVSEGKRNGIKLPDLKGDFEAQQAKRQEALQAYLKNTKHGTKDEKIREDIEAENADFTKATADLDRKSKGYADALKAHQARIAEIKNRDKEKAGKKIDPTDGMDDGASRAYANAFKALSDAQVEASVKAQELTGSEAILYRLMQSPEWERMPEPWRKLIQGQQEATAVAEQAARAEANLRAAYDRTIQPLRDRLAELQKENDLYGLTEAQINTVIATRLDEAAATARANGATEEQIASLERERDLRLEIAQQSGTKDLQDMDRKKIQDEADQMKRITDDVAQAFTDAIFRGGKSGWELLKSTIESTIIRTTILPMIQGQLSSMTGASGGIGSFLSGLFGGKAAGASASGTAGAAAESASGGGFFSGLLAKLPSFDVGTAYVPRDMYAKIHQGERILTRSENARYGQGGGNPINITFNSQGAMDARTGQQMALTAGAAVRRALARNG